ncbi:MAG: serine/threonine-protein kinase, partial [Actinomycetota bacterium]
PSVVSVYDTGEHEGIPFIVMELLSGRTLAHEMSDGPLDAERAVRLVGEALAGLQAAHAAGIVHRDVKPGNILFTADGEHVKVGDFGIAKGAEGLDVTQTGSLIGTPSFLAPERIHGKPATVESDLYSVGVVLYEALSGKRPFEADNPIGLANQIQNEQAPDLEEVRPDLHPGLAAVVRRAMQKDPAVRYQSADEMAIALAAALSPRETGDATVVTAMASPDDTRVISREPAPEYRAAPARRPGPFVLRNVVAVGIFLVVLLIGALLLQNLNSSGGSPGPGQSTIEPGSPSLPQPLEDAVARLERAVRP